MIAYREYTHNSFTLEVYEFSKNTTVKLFEKADNNEDEELFRMEYVSSSPIVTGCINELIKLMQNDIYKYNKEN